MNKIIYIALSIILAYIFIFMLPFAWSAIFAAIPLLLLKPKNSFIAGFLIGIIAPLSIYVIYPINYVLKLSNILGNIVGFPAFIILIIFPLIYGIIMAISAAIWSGLYDKVKK